jgi:hypothetical protein
LCFFLNVPPGPVLHPGQFGPLFFRGAEPAGESLYFSTYMCTPTEFSPGSSLAAELSGAALIAQISMIFSKKY